MLIACSNEQGKPLYSFIREDFYANAQQSIDEARNNGTDYVIALTHLATVEKRANTPTQSI